MKIAINTLPAIVGAGPTFFRNFLPELARVGGRHDYLVLVAADQEAVLAAIPPNMQTLLVRLPRNYFLRFFWEQLVLPLILWRRKVDVLYMLGNVTSLLAPCRKVTVVTGANPYSSLRLNYGRRDRLKHAVIRAVSRLAAVASHRVVFISNDSRNRLAGRLGVRAEKARVIPYGVALPPPAAAPAPISEPYILTVSVLYRHKNFERLMVAFDRLVSSGAFSGRLVIAGAVHDRAYYGELTTLRDGLDAADRILFTESLSPVELHRYYVNALAFVFPSLEETLGLPLLEAMAYGLPIAASDGAISPRGAALFSPFRELAGEAAIYFDPFDVAAMTDAIRRLVLDGELRGRLCQAAVQRAGLYSWRSVAERTVAVLDSLDTDGR